MPFQIIEAFSKFVIFFRTFLIIYPKNENMKENIYPRSLYFLTGSFKEVYFNCLPIYSEILILQRKCFFLIKHLEKPFGIFVLCILSVHSRVTVFALIIFALKQTPYI